MQDPNQDTQWNDALRLRGILPPKKSGAELEISEDAIVKLVEDEIEGRKEVKNYEDMSLDEIEALEDNEDERVLQSYRQKRILELQEKMKKSIFGEVREITAEDYKREVNGAGKGVWVVLHLYKSGIPLCSLINQHLVRLSAKYPQIKFLKSISDLCIPNFPDRNLPAVFVYFEGELKSQMVGALTFGGLNLTADDVDHKLFKAGVPTEAKEDPRPKMEDFMMRSLGQTRPKQDDDDDDNDW